MSQQLINHSPDLKRLRDEGYEIEIVSGLLVIRNVPYVNTQREVKRADLISTLILTGNQSARPDTHVVNFTGEHPCDKDGNKLTKIVNASNTTQLAGGIKAQHTFSSKPKEGYRDYYDKMTTYIAILSSPAQAVDSRIDAKTFRPIESSEGESVFKYVDTATSRAGIYEVSKKLESLKIAIIGLGGTGSYIFDLVAKTPVQEIHLYDADWYFLHNAYRSPGVPSKEDLQTPQKKVDYYRNKYSDFRSGIFAHPCYVDHETVNELSDMDFVFISIDGGKDKALIFDKLEEFGIPFIDVGMGVYLVKEKAALGGVLRVTTSTVYQREHAKNRVSFAEETDHNNVYGQNIQTAGLNSLNASLAVHQWMQLFGFYLDLEKEHSSMFMIDGNIITNEDKPCAELETV